MPNPFAGGSPVEKANVEAEAVVPEVDGVEPESTPERTFTTADVEQIVKDRLAREQKKFLKERSEWESKQTPKVPSTNVEEDLRNKLSDYETRTKQLSEKLTQYQQSNLRAQVERKLAAADCLDPELVTDTFLARNLVRLDDDGSTVVAENATGRLDDLITDYLSRKPHLRRASVTTGVGSRPPSRPAASSGNPAEMSTEELRQQMGFSDSKKHPFRR